MQKKIYSNNQLNKLVVVKKPIYISSNIYLNRIKRKYKSKKAGFSGTLDPFAKGCLIVAFGQYSKLFRYIKKTPKVYKAVVWLGTISSSLDIENIINIESEKKLKLSLIEQEVKSLIGTHNYYPPKYSAKKIDGQRAYKLARENKIFDTKLSNMEVYKSKLISYNHPFITFEASVSEGSYIRSLAQILLKNLKRKGTLSHLERLSEGSFLYENEKDLNPLDYIDIPRNEYFGEKRFLEDGREISIDYLKLKEEGKYLLIFDDFFSIIEIENKKIKYLLNKVGLN